MLHDIGTTSTNITGTLMSFEFYGAKVAYEKLLSLGADKAQAEAVMEAIIRHQDLGETGTITELGQIIQLATVFDNVGMNPDLITKELIESVTSKWKRNGWTGCFASTVRKEIGLKPYCHTTAIDGFAEKVEGNKLMEPYD
jgi:cyanamide hydratase